MSKFITVWTYFTKNFEKIFFVFCAVWFFIYVSFSLSPSSYGIALDLLNVENKPFLGEARSIRSDEWAVWTPYLQMVVNNNFERFYEMPEYLIDFRGFNILPLFDLMLIFKPFVWGFFIFEPSIAFSIYNALISLSFIVGWHLLLKKLFSQVHNISYYSILFSLILFFTGFTQYWLTTLGPILATTPWLILSIINKSKYRFFILFYVSICWLLSHTYPPIIVQVAYLGLIFIIIYENSWNKKIFLDYILKLGVCLASTCIVVYYLYDALLVMSNTLYPGKRIALGGDGFWQLWLSSFFPYIAIDGYKDLIKLNISEIGTVSSLLPLIALCFIKISKDTLFNKTSLVFLLAIFVTSLWMFFDFPIWFSKITLLYLVPAHRALYILGILVNLYSFYLIIMGEVRVNLSRYFIFSIIILFSYLFPSILGYIPFGSKSGWELYTIPLLIFLFFINFERKVYFISLALLINLFYTFNFNPLQSTRPIFSIINSKLIDKLGFEKNQDGWITEPGYPGAILAGIGEKSFSNVLIQPQLKYFRSLFPNMSKSEFEDIFNRYAHVQLSLNDMKPYTPSPDVIVIPMKVINPNYPLIKEIKLKVVNVYTTNEYSDIRVGGAIDSISFDNGILKITGWMLSNSNELILLTNNKWNIIKLNKLIRRDVMIATSESDLKYSGFYMELRLILTEKDTFFKPVCLLSNSKKYGARSLISDVNSKLYNCDMLYEK